MAHLPPNAAIFSPSVARAAASAAKDWSYVDTWLQRKFPGRGPPPFERNVDTLRALLALASANEAADEERALIARLEADTLQQLRAQEQPHNQDENDNNTLQSAREAILTSLEAALTREGQTALTAMASLAVQTNTPLPTPTTLVT
jgi:HAUS augmin-like complex subunit 1